MSMLILPTTSGWSVEWYTGEIRTFYKGTPWEKQVRMKNSFETTSKARAEAKAEEMRKQGYEIIGIYECIF